MNRSRFLPCLLLFAALLAGCGKSTTPASLTGTVTYKDKVVTAGTVTLHTSSGVVYGPASIDATGSYTILQVPAGDGQLTVETESANDKVAKPTYGGAKGAKGSSSSTPTGAKSGATAPTGEYVKIPKKYSDVKTGIPVTLTSGKTTKDLTLTD